MISKITAYSFILIANLILLAHAVIPHHHHQSVVCVTETECHDDKHEHDHDFSAKEHQHDENENTSACILNQALITTSKDRLLKNCNNCSYNQNHDFYFFSVQEKIVLQPISATETTACNLNPFITTYVAINLGFRGPPVI